MLRKLFFLTVGTFSLLASSEENSKEVNFFAQSGEALSTGSVKIFIYPKEELQKAEISFEGTKSFSLMEKRKRQGDLFPLGTATNFQAREGERYLVRATRQDGTSYIHRLIASKKDSEVVLKVEVYDGKITEPVSQPAAGKPVAGAPQSGDELFNLINQYRVSMGMNALAWDPSLCIPDDNRHSKYYAGQLNGAAQSAWAWNGSNSPQTYLSTWKNSPPHNAILLRPGTSAGIGYEPQVWNRMNGIGAAFNIK